MKLLQSKNYVPTKKAPLYRRTQRSLFSSADDVEFHKNNARLLIFDIGNNTILEITNAQGVFQSNSVSHPWGKPMADTSTSGNNANKDWTLTYISF